MAEVTYYVSLPFVAADDGIAAGEPTECFNPTAAVMRAEALSRREVQSRRSKSSTIGARQQGDPHGRPEAIRRLGLKAKQPR